MKTTVTQSFGGRRHHLAIMRNSSTGLWALAWAIPTAHGHAYETPIETGFKTRREAQVAKRNYLGYPPLELEKFRRYLRCRS